MTAVGCGKKGPPLAPLRLTPAQVGDLTIRRLGNDIYLQFTIPATNSDGTTPADLRTVEAFGLTARPGDMAGRLATDDEFLDVAVALQPVEVEPPPEKDEEPREEPPAGAAPADPRPAQGEPVTLAETIDPGMQVPWTPAPLPVPEAEAPAAVVHPAWTAPLVSPPDVTPMRYYAVAGRSRRGRLGPLSPRLGVGLGPLPPTPASPSVTYDEGKYTIEWQEPPGARRPVQDSTGAGVLPARLVIPGPAPHTYNVYEVRSAAPGTTGEMPAPLNAMTLPGTRSEVAGVSFDIERCFVVRTVEVSRAATVESDPSPPACVTARDTFPPAAPGDLAAVGGEGAINLIWEPSTGADLAGYLVLRGEAPGEQLQAVTPAPVRETTYRDANVRQGVRYVYAVVAIDTAKPPNVSAQSNRVEETAR